MTACYGVLFIKLYLLLKFFANHNSKRETAVIKAERSIPLLQFVSFVPGLLLILFIYVLDVLRMGNIIDLSTLEQIYRSIGL